MSVDDVINNKQGGNAVQNASRIDIDNFLPTLLEIEEQILLKLNLRLKDIGILGSGGKKPSSGDIDIALKMDIKNAKFITSLGYDYKLMEAINICSIEFPIYNNKYQKTGENVQVDLMFVDSVEFAMFSYYSSPKSNYKGLFRNEIFYTVAKLAEYEAIEIEDGEEVVIKRLQFDLNKGLMTMVQSRRGKKNKINKGYKCIEKSLLTNDVNQVIELLFGANVSEDDVSTLEGCFKVLESPNFIYKSKLPEILNLLAINMINKVRKHKILTKHEISMFMYVMGAGNLSEENNLIFEEKIDEALTRIFG